MIPTTPVRSELVRGLGRFAEEFDTGCPVYLTGRTQHVRSRARLVPALELPGQGIVGLIASALSARNRAWAGLMRRIDIARYAARGRRVEIARTKLAAGRRHRDQGEQHGLQLHPEFLPTKPTTASVRTIPEIGRSAQDRSYGYRMLPMSFCDRDLPVASRLS